MSSCRDIFITGGTGYMGRSLIPLLLQRGHKVTAVAREASQHKLPGACGVVVAEALKGATWQQHLKPFHTLLHLVGVAHPGPSKARQFVEIDLAGATEAVKVARETSIHHFVYVSVAQAAPAMKAYVNVRSQCEAQIREAGLNATILRPWYVLGPGHWWPLALLPLYKAAEMVPATRSAAQRLGLLKLTEMTAALAHAVENPHAGLNILEVPGIRAIARQAKMQ